MLLKNVNNLNPQTLANTIVKSALQKNGFIAKDDMTALVVRIIKKIN
jgi:serine/threonine protein phosphatase PrpC